MIELLGTIFSFVMDIIALCVNIVVDAIGFVFSLLGGLFSLLMGVGGIALIVVLVHVFRKRRLRQQQSAQKILVDEDGEEFVSYYHQEE